MFQEFCKESRKSYLLQNVSESSNGQATLWKGHKNIHVVEEDTNIMSPRGTVRGVRNRVRAGIATFVHDDADGMVKKCYRLC